MSQLREEMITAISQTDLIIKDCISSVERNPDASNIVTKGREIEKLLVVKKTLEAFSKT